MKNLKKFVMLAVALTMALSMFTTVYASQSNQITVTINDIPITFTDQPPVIVGGRTLVPIRDVFEALGFVTTWIEETQTVVLTSENDTISITIGSSLFYTNYLPGQLDVPAQIIGGRTMLPIRALVESVGYQVDWDGTTQTISITSPHTLPVQPADTISIEAIPNLDSFLNLFDFVDRGKSNLSPQDTEIVHWITATAAIINYGNRSSHILIGDSSAERFILEISGISNLLLNSWGIRNADDLRQQVTALLERGHNEQFIELYGFVSEYGLAIAALIAAEEPEVDIDDIIKSLELITYIGDKWGDAGIVAWDLFRIGTLVSWGYFVDYIEFEEALYLMKPAIALLQAHFSSWDEAVENYLDGFAYWANIDMNAPNTEFTARHEIYNNLKSIDGLFDDSLFTSIPIGTQRGADGLYTDIDYIYMLTGFREPRPATLDDLDGYWIGRSGFSEYYFNIADNTARRVSYVERIGYLYIVGTFTLSPDGILAITHHFYIHDNEEWTTSVNTPVITYRVQMASDDELLMERNELSTFRGWGHARSNGELFERFYQQQ